MHVHLLLFQRCTATRLPPSCANTAHFPVHGAHLFATCAQHGVWSSVASLCDRGGAPVTGPALGSERSFAAGEQFRLQNAACHEVSVCKKCGALLRSREAATAGIRRPPVHCWQPTRSRGIKRSSDPCFRNTLPAVCEGLMPTPSAWRGQGQGTARVGGARLPQLPPRQPCRCRGGSPRASGWRVRRHRAGVGCGPAAVTMNEQPCLHGGSSCMRHHPRRCAGCPARCPAPLL